jgi:hypothetical protein
VTTRPIVPAILFAVIINFGPVDFARADSSDVDQIRALESKLAAAAEARNIDAIMKAYIPNETLFVFDVIPPRQYVGAKAFRTDSASCSGWYRLNAYQEGRFVSCCASASKSAPGRLSEHGYDGGLFVCAAARRSLVWRWATALSNIITAWLWPARL